MKTVLISIKEKWWKKILSNEKELEIRKNRPKGIEYPFRVVCYVTGRGIMGAFTCDYSNTQTGPTEKPILVFMAGTSGKERRLNSTRRSRLTRPELPDRRKAGVIFRNTRRTWSRIASMARLTEPPTTTRKKP